MRINREARKSKKHRHFMSLWSDVHHSLREVEARTRYIQWAVVVGQAVVVAAVVVAALVWG